VPSSGRPVLTVGFWRSRRSAAVAGIIFAILILIALVMTRIALTEVTLDALRADPERRRLIRISLNLVPFAGIAFLWFIGVIRDQLGDVEDRLFSTVFLGSGLLFLAMLFSGTVTLTGLMEVVATTDPDVGVYGFGRSTTQTLVSVYAMRMAAVFTLSVSTVGIRTRSLPRWVSYLGYVVALTLMVAAGEHKWTQLVFPTWVLLVSVVLLLVRPPVRSGTPIAPGTPVTPGTPD
jgi:hypothetical protein